MSPITFADVVKGEKGDWVPSDPNLHEDADQMTMQALDYMFLLEPNDKVVEKEDGQVAKNTDYLKMKLNIHKT